MNTACCSGPSSSERTCRTRKGSGKSSRGDGSYGMVSTQLSAKEVQSFPSGKGAEEMMEG